MPVVDAKFGVPRLAAVYDAVDADRSDLDAYRRIAATTGARTVLDVGCGTGVLALLLAADGVAVTGVDPATASLDVARAKPGAGRVRWIEGDATAAAGGPFDLVVMTGNAAMAVLDDGEWAATLAAVRRRLAPRGRLVFETRDPAARAWEAWAAEVGVRRSVDAGPAGRLETGLTAVRFADPVVEFTETTVFADGTRLESRSRLRYRSRAELRSDLAAAGLAITEVRGAPDRPGLELVVLAQPA